MMKRLWVAALLLTAASPAAASTFFPRTVACPVGGKPFTYMAYGSYSRWGALPDGQPVGSARYPLELPQCPDNGLVLYAEFDPATVARLKPLVLGPDYQALRRTETRYYLAWWLRDRLGEQGMEPLWTLLAATWEAKNEGEPARAARYNELFVARVRAMPADPASLHNVALRARAANALRELGRFDDAEALRASIAIGQAAGGGGDDGAKNRAGWRSYLDELRPVIARHDPGRAPIDLIGQRDAVFRCLGPELRAEIPPLTAFEKGYCATPAMVEAIAKQRELLRPAIKPSS